MSDTNDNSQELPPGATIGDYEVVREIGHGGMGVVYEVAHRELRAHYALKVFRVPDGPDRGALREKFLAEARVMAALRHPNIVRVFQSGSLADPGRAYLVEDLVGVAAPRAAAAREDPAVLLRPNATCGAPVPLPLAELVAAARPVPEALIVRIYGDLRAALACCHAKGIVHSDLKAENVLMTGDGHALLTDFGIARILDPRVRTDLDLAMVTLPGGAGTAYYLAPECVRGGKPTPAGDIYAFGVLLFKLVTGIWYEGSRRLIEEADTLAPGWAPLLRRMLAADPRHRIALAASLPPEPVVPASAFRGVRAGRLCGALAAFAAVALLGAAAYRFWPAPAPSITSAGNVLRLADGATLRLPSAAYTNAIPEIVVGGGCVLEYAAGSNAKLWNYAHAVTVETGGLISLGGGLRQHVGRAELWRLHDGARVVSKTSIVSMGHVIRALDGVSTVELGDLCLYHGGWTADVASNAVMKLRLDCLVCYDFWTHGTFNKTGPGRLEVSGKGLDLVAGVNIADGTFALDSPWKQDTAGYFGKGKTPGDWIVGRTATLCGTGSVAFAATTMARVSGTLAGNIHLSRAELEPGAMLRPDAGGVFVDDLRLPSGSATNRVRLVQTQARPGVLLRWRLATEPVTLLCEPLPGFAFRRTPDSFEVVPQ